MTDPEQRRRMKRVLRIQFAKAGRLPKAPCCMHFIAILLVFVGI